MSADELEDDDEFESLDLAQLSGVGEIIVYEVPNKVSLRSKESAIVQIATEKLIKTKLGLTNLGEVHCPSFNIGAWIKE